MMTLSQEDGKLFYKLWLPLLDYVNRKYKINKRLKSMSDAKSLDPKDVKAVADKLWENIQLIDEYLDGIGQLPEEHRAIIQSWKRRIQGQFMMERHLKNGTIFISMDDEKVYQVSGIISSWEEMFFCAPMPIIIGATFLPFRDVIISDGLIISYNNILVGGGMKKIFKDIYLTAKKNGEICRSL